MGGLVAATAAPDGRLCRSITAFVLAFLAVWEVGPFRPVFSLACWTVILMLIQNVTKRDHDTAMDELRRRLPPTQVGSGTA